MNLSDLDENISSKQKIIDKMKNVGIFTNRSLTRNELIGLLNEVREEKPDKILDKMRTEDLVRLAIDNDIDGYHGLTRKELIDKIRARQMIN